jgi:predicted lipoprotein with Yx(FWY)xxD motif
MSRTHRIVATLVVSLLCAACGSSTTKTSGTTTPTAAAGPKTVATATDSTLGAILVDSTGRTLYHNTKESGSTIVCTATCASTWPPLTIPTGSAPTWASGLTGSKFGTVSRPDGLLQVTYANWPLYTFASDSKAGDTKGQGVAGVWFAVTAAGTSAGSSGSTGSSATTSTTSSYGY